jgi:ubiquinone/menaquinone biosynthesis C-methylase UbiE
VSSLGESVERRVDFVARLEALTGALAGRTVLDLGCGRHALWSRAYAAHGARVVAVELDPARCVEAVARLGAAPPSGPGRVLAVVHGDGERLPLRDETVHFVHCAQVLEHVASPAAILAELRRVLVPGGHAYVTAINRHAFRDPHFGVVGVNWLPRRLADRVLVLLGAENPEGQPLSAMHYFSRRGFRRLCERSGLPAVADLKRRERLARHGPVGGRLADAWGAAVRSAAFHVVVRRPAVRGRTGA